MIVIHHQPMKKEVIKMGFLDKVKNLFTEEVENTEEIKPIKKEVMQVSIPAPVETIEPDLNEEVAKEPAPTREEKNTNLFFDDKDFEVLDKPREVARNNNENLYTTYKPHSRAFKLSPIISPVYGILDKNYTKDDITDISGDTSSYDYKGGKALSVDDVRNKAYGEAPKSILFSKEDDLKLKEETNNMFDDLAATDKEKMTLEELDNLAQNDANQDKGKHEAKEAVSNDELFNLIDSMYANGGEKNNDD